MVTSDEISRVESPTVFKSTIVTRTLAICSATDGSLIVNIAHVSLKAVSLLAGLILVVY